LKGTRKTPAPVHKHIESAPRESDASPFGAPRCSCENEIFERRPGLWSPATAAMAAEAGGFERQGGGGSGPAKENRRRGCRVGVVGRKWFPIGEGEAALRPEARSSEQEDGASPLPARSFGDRLERRSLGDVHEPISDSGTGAALGPSGCTLRSRRFNPGERPSKEKACLTRRGHPESGGREEHLTAIRLSASVVSVPSSSPGSPGSSFSPTPREITAHSRRLRLTGQLTGVAEIIGSGSAPRRDPRSFSPVRGGPWSTFHQGPGLGTAGRAGVHPAQWRSAGRRSGRRRSGSRHPLPSPGPGPAARRRPAPASRGEGRGGHDGGPPGCDHHDHGRPPAAAARRSPLPPPPRRRRGHRGAPQRRQERARSGSNKTGAGRGRAGRCCGARRDASQRRGWPWSWEGRRRAARRLAGDRLKMKPTQSSIRMQPGCRVSALL
jgi:hypothetical protein